MTALAPALVALSAFVYAMVGHGGASAYLAIMTLLGRDPVHAASAALLLNLVVSATAATSFARQGHAGGRLVGPFLLGSVPAAFVGGWLRLPHRVAALLVAACLVAAAVRLWLPLPGGDGEEAPPRPPRLPVAAALGALIGFLAGAVGIGGGVLLSPLLILKGWAGPKRTAGAAAAFIFVNSLAGLAARVAARRFAPADAFLFLPWALAGGLAGGWLGAARLPGRMLVRVLCGVLLVAAAGGLLR